MSQPSTSYPPSQNPNHHNVPKSQSLQLQLRTHRPKIPITTTSPNSNHFNFNFVSTGSKSESAHRLQIPITTPSSNSNHFNFVNPNCPRNPELKWPLNYRYVIFKSTKFRAKSCVFDLHTTFPRNSNPQNLVSRQKIDPELKEILRI